MEFSELTRYADVSRARSVAGGILVLVPLIAGALSPLVVDSNATLLVAGATPFVIVEVIAKLIEFLLHAKDRDDWFADVFEQVRVPTALMSGSFIAGSQAIEHLWAAMVGLGLLVPLLVAVRSFRPRERRVPSTITETGRPSSPGRPGQINR